MRNKGLAQAQGSLTNRNHFFITVLCLLLSASCFKSLAQKNSTGILEILSPLEELDLDADVSISSRVFSKNEMSRLQLGSNVKEAALLSANRESDTDNLHFRLSFILVRLDDLGITKTVAETGIVDFDGDQCLGKGYFALCSEVTGLSLNECLKNPGSSACKQAGILPPTEIAKGGVEKIIENVSREAELYRLDNGAYPSDLSFLEDDVYYNDDLIAYVSNNGELRNISDRVSSVLVSEVDSNKSMTLVLNGAGEFSGITCFKHIPDFAFPRDKEKEYKSCLDQIMSSFTEQEGQKLTRLIDNTRSNIENTFSSL